MSFKICDCISKYLLNYIRSETVLDCHTNISFVLLFDMQHRICTCNKLLSEQRGLKISKKGIDKMCVQIGTLTLTFLACFYHIQELVAPRRPACVHVDRKSIQDSTLCHSSGNGSYCHRRDFASNFRVRGGGQKWP
jgi:hypothetical protein